MVFPSIRALYSLKLCCAAAEKAAGAWQQGTVGQSALLAPAGQKLRLPVAVLVTNQSPPVGDKPSLMNM